MKRPNIQKTGTTGRERKLKGPYNDYYRCNIRLRAIAILEKDENYLSTLSNWLKLVIQNKSANWKCCWPTTMEGQVSTSCQSFCDNKGPTVTIIHVGCTTLGDVNIL